MQFFLPQAMRLKGPGFFKGQRVVTIQNPFASLFIHILLYFAF
jgi:hypothetical protein